MFIETHSHLDFPDFQEDLDAVIQRAHDAGISKMISIAAELESNQRVVQLAEKYPSIYATVGVHPCHATEVSDDFCKELRKWVHHPRVVAIGETGLDYYRLPSKVAAMQSSKPLDEVKKEALLKEDAAIKQRQADVFHQQLDLAAEFKLNVVIHQRDSWEDTLAILAPYQGKLRGVFHCFGGTLEQALQVIDLGHLVSFTGIVTFKNARQVQKVATKLPVGKFMVETDCPYMSPTPHRGERCEPAYVRLIAQKIAELRGISLEEVAVMTTQTAHNFFRFA